MAYTVQCPSCSTEFPVDPAKVPEGGVNARCSSCAEVFSVEKPAEEPQGGVAAVEAPVEMPAEESAGFEEPAAEEPEAPPAPAEEEEEAEEEADGEPAFAESPDAAPPEFSSEPAGAGEVEIGDDDFVLEQETLYGGGEEEEAGETATGEAEAGVELEEEPTAEALEVEEEPAEEPPAEEPSGEAPAGLAGTGDAAPSPGPVQFGQRSPEDKAKRLARVLVSDMILYNPQRHTRAMENDNLAEEFEDEIKKSWEEYVEQVGEELADSTSYFTDALNEILAKGQEIF